MFHFKLFILLLLTKESWTGAKLKLTVSRVALQWPYTNAVKHQISTTGCCLLNSSQKRAQTQTAKPSSSTKPGFFFLYKNSISSIMSATSYLFRHQCYKEVVYCAWMADTETRSGSARCKIPWAPGSPLESSKHLEGSQTNYFSINYNINEKIIPKWEFRMMSAWNVSHYICMDFVWQQNTLNPILLSS